MRGACTVPPSSEAAVKALADRMLGRGVVEAELIAVLRGSQLTKADLPPVNSRNVQRQGCPAGSYEPPRLHGSSGAGGGADRKPLGGMSIRAGDCRHPELGNNDSPQAAGMVRP